MQLAKDRRIPYYFVAFFVGLVLIDGVMVTLAVRTQTGIVTKHPYEEGLAYNRTIEASKEQAALGWKGTLQFLPRAGQRAKITFTLADGQGKSIDADAVKVTFTRPTQDGYDFEQPLQHIGSRYSAMVAMPLPGLWELRVFAKAQGKTYQQSQRVVVQ